MDALFILKEAVSLGLSLLKTSGMTSSVTIDALLKTLLSLVEYVVSSIDASERYLYSAIMWPYIG